MWGHEPPPQFWTCLWSARNPRSKMTRQVTYHPRSFIVYNLSTPFNKLDVFTDQYLAQLNAQLSMAVAVCTVWVNFTKREKHGLHSCWWPCKARAIGFIELCCCYRLASLTLVGYLRACMTLPNSILQNTCSRISVGTGQAHPSCTVSTVLWTLAYVINSGNSKATCVPYCTSLGL